MGPFTIKDEFNNVLAVDVSRETLKTGIAYTVDDAVNVIVICSTGRVKKCKNFSIGEFNVYEYADTGNLRTKIDFENYKLKDLPLFPQHDIMLLWSRSSNLD